MNAKQVYEALVSDGYLSPDPEDIRAESEKQAEFEHNSYWVRAILYRQNQIIDEYDYLLDDTEDELDGLSDETRALMEFATPKDYVGEEVME